MKCKGKTGTALMESWDVIAFSFGELTVLTGIGHPRIIPEHFGQISSSEPM
jgi:hypothetical protein